MFESSHRFADFTTVPQAIGIQISPSAGLVMTTKKPASCNKPASSYTLTKFGSKVGSRKLVHPASYSQRYVL